MPPPRRRPVPPPPPTWRPRVAGLRHPDGQGQRQDADPGPGAADSGAAVPASGTAASGSGAAGSGAAGSGAAGSGAAGSGAAGSGAASSGAADSGGSLRGSLADAPPAGGRRSRRPVPAEGANEQTATLAEPIRDRAEPGRAANRRARSSARAGGAATAEFESGRPPGGRLASRRRPSPSPEPAEPQVADLADTPAEPRAEGGLLDRGGLRVPIALGVVAVLLGGLAVFFGVQWANRTDSSANTALTDNAGTSEVIGQVVAAVNTTFSYNYTNVDKTKQAAQNLLTGNALCQYNALFKVIQQQAPSQKLVLTTTVSAKGVQDLRGDTARVLLIVDQKDFRVSTNQPVQTQAALTVSAVRQGSTWKISNIDTFNGQSQTPGCS